MTDERIILNLPRSLHNWALDNKDRETEAWEQLKLVYWMQKENLKFTSIPNSTFTKSIQQKMKNNALGLCSGLCDLLIIIPVEKSKTNRSELVFIELKRVKGGRVSDSQKEWIEAINGANVDAHIAKGASEAIEILESYMK